MQVRGDFCGGCVNIFQVGVPVSSSRGCAYGDKHEVGVANPVVKLSRKLQSPRLYVAQYEIIQARFIDGYYAIPQRLYLSFIYINARDIRAELSKTGSGD